MIGAGDLHDKVGFYRRATLGVDSPPATDYGNTEGDFAVVFTASAQIKPRLGGEGVLAARLTGTNLLNITVRRSAATAAVTTDWVVKDMRKSETYNIRSIIDPYQATPHRGRWVEMLCEKGVAVGMDGPGIAPVDSIGFDFSQAANSQYIPLISSI